jgi:hypothetical protein
MDARKIRDISIETASQLGYPTNVSLPLLGPVEQIRPLNDVVARLLAMHCAAAAAYGFGGPRALAWYRRESPRNLLTRSETSFLSTGTGDRRQFMLQVEGMWALAWCLRLIETLCFSEACSTTFVTVLPDLKRDEASDELRSRVELRPLEDVVQALDLAYCLHWGATDAALRGHAMGAIESHVIVDRRRALEWVVTDEDWESIQLDT